MNIETNLKNLQKEIKQTAEKVKRDPKEIQLVVVSKKQPSKNILSLFDLGVRDFGENKIQEFFLKKEECPKEIRWHFIGTLQKNKVRKAVGNFSLIHSVDSLELAQKIAEVSQEMNKISPILIQVKTSFEESKQGLSESEWEKKFDALLSLPQLFVKGFMTMAPLTEDKNLIRQSFSSLRRFRDAMREKYHLKTDHPEFLYNLSMGMSHDFKFAIEEGATLLRIGSKIFED